MQAECSIFAENSEFDSRLSKVQMNQQKNAGTTRRHPDDSTTNNSQNDAPNGRNTSEHSSTYNGSTSSPSFRGRTRSSLKIFSEHSSIRSAGAVQQAEATSSSEEQDKKPQIDATFFDHNQSHSDKIDCGSNVEKGHQNGNDGDESCLRELNRNPDISGKAENSSIVNSDGDNSFEGADGFLQRDLVNEFDWPYTPLESERQHEVQCKAHRKVCRWTRDKIRRYISQAEILDAYSEDSGSHRHREHEHMGELCENGCLVEDSQVSNEELQEAGLGEPIFDDFTSDEEATAKIHEWEKVPGTSKQNIDPAQSSSDSESEAEVAPEAQQLLQMTMQGKIRDKAPDEDEMDDTESSIDENDVAATAFYQVPRVSSSETSPKKTVEPNLSVLENACSTTRLNSETQSLIEKPTPPVELAEVTVESTKIDQLFEDVAEIKKYMKELKAELKTGEHTDSLSQSQTGQTGSEVSEDEKPKDRPNFEGFTRSTMKSTRGAICSVSPPRASDSSHTPKQQRQRATQRYLAPTSASRARYEEGKRTNHSKLTKQTNGVKTSSSKASSSKTSSRKKTVDQAKNVEKGRKHSFALNNQQLHDNNQMVAAKSVANREQDEVKKTVRTRNKPQDPPLPDLASISQLLEDLRRRSIEEVSSYGSSRPEQLSKLLEEINSLITVATETANVSNISPSMHENIQELLHELNGSIKSYIQHSKRNENLCPKGVAEEAHKEGNQTEKESLNGENCLAKKATTRQGKLKQDQSPKFETHYSNDEDGLECARQGKDNPKQQQLLTSQKNYSGDTEELEGFSKDEFSFNNLPRSQDDPSTFAQDLKFSFENRKDETTRNTNSLKASDDEQLDIPSCSEVMTELENSIGLRAGNSITENEHAHSSHHSSVPESRGGTPTTSAATKRNVVSSMSESTKENVPGNTITADEHASSGNQSGVPKRLGGMSTSSTTAITASKQSLVSSMLDGTEQNIQSNTVTAHPNCNEAADTHLGRETHNPSGEFVTDVKVNADGQIIKEGQHSEAIRENCKDASETAPMSEKVVHASETSVNANQSEWIGGLQSQNDYNKKDEGAYSNNSSVDNEVYQHDSTDDDLSDSETSICATDRICLKIMQPYEVNNQCCIKISETDVGRYARILDTTQSENLWYVNLEDSTEQGYCHWKTFTEPGGTKNDAWRLLEEALSVDTEEFKEEHTGGILSSTGKPNCSIRSSLSPIQEDTTDRRGSPSPPPPPPPPPRRQCKRTAPGPIPPISRPPTIKHLSNDSPVSGSAFSTEIVGSHFRPTPPATMQESNMEPHSNSDLSRSTFSTETGNQVSSNRARNSTAARNTQQPAGLLAQPTPPATGQESNREQDSHSNVVSTRDGQMLFGSTHAVPDGSFNRELDLDTQSRKVQSESSDSGASTTSDYTRSNENQHPMDSEDPFENRNSRMEINVPRTRRKGIGTAAEKRDWVEDGVNVVPKVPGTLGKLGSNISRIDSRKRLK